MARINLLPWRDWERERLRKEFLAVLGVAVAVGVAFVLAGYLYFGNAVANQNERNAYLEEKIAELQKQVEEIEKLQKQKQQMQERIDVVQNLQAGRSVTVMVLDGLVHALPDGVYFTKLSLTGDKMSIDGTAEANARISSLMRSLDESALFDSPNLVSVKANPAFGESASNFTLNVKVVLPGAKTEDEVDAKSKSKSKSKSKK